MNDGCGEDPYTASAKREGGGAEALRGPEHHRNEGAPEGPHYLRHRGRAVEADVRCRRSDGRHRCRSRSHHAGPRRPGELPGVDLRPSGRCARRAIENLEIEVETDYDARGAFGIGEVPPGWTGIRSRVTIESSAPEEDGRRVLDAAHATYRQVEADGDAAPRQLSARISSTTGGWSRSLLSRPAGPSSPRRLDSSRRIGSTARCSG